MKKKLVEHTLPVPAAEENCVTVQKVENILILNIFENRKLSARYCINLDTNEYMTLKDGIWHEWKLQTAVWTGICRCQIRTAEGSGNIWDVWNTCLWEAP